MNPLDPRGAALHTELQQVATAAAAWDHGRNQRATIEIACPRLPPGDGFLVACGLDPVLQYLLDFQLTTEEIGYTKHLYWFHTIRKEFWDLLAELRFTGDVWAAPEGTPVFAGEPLLRLTGPLVELLVVEPYVRATLSFETAVATRAARLAEAARGRPVIHMGLASAASASASLLAARAAYCAGAAGTTHLAAGWETGVPIFTGGHPAFLSAFVELDDALRAWHGVLHETGVLPLPASDPVGAARRVAELGLELRAVRIDAGAFDLAAAAREIRAALDGAGLAKVKIWAAGDLDETTLAGLTAGGAPIDAFAVAGALADPGSGHRPRLEATLVAMRGPGGEVLPVPARGGVPGVKQVFRSFGVDGRARRDLLALDGEKQLGAPVLQEWLRSGTVTQSRPGLETIRAYAARAIASVPPAVRRIEAPEAFPIETSAALAALREAGRAF